MFQLLVDVLGTDNPLLVVEEDNKNISLSYRLKRAKTALIVSAGKKWLRLEKEYLHYYWIYDAKISMAGEKGGDLSASKGILFII